MRSYVLVKVSGKDIKRYIGYLYKKKIEVSSLQIIDYKTCILKLDKHNYERLEEIKSSYEVNIYKYEGLLHIKSILLKYKLAFISVLIWFLLIILFSNIIFEIEIVSTNTELSNLLIKELEKNNISKYKFIKNRSSINKVKQSILKEHNQYFEWIEITRVGTKYSVKFVEKVQKSPLENEQSTMLIATKSGLVKNVICENGFKLVEVDQYINKGDVLIDSTMNINGNIKDTGNVLGEVYAEVWYTVKMSFPLNLKQVNYTNNIKEMYSITFLNKNYGLFDFSPYADYNTSKKVIIKDNILPISLNKEKRYEVNRVDEIYTYEEALEKSILYAEDKIKEGLSDKEYIIKKKVLKNEQKESMIEVELFVVVYESIGKYVNSMN